MRMLTRRTFSSTLMVCALIPAGLDAAAAPSLLTLIRHPLLVAFYREPALVHVGPDGTAGFNFTGGHAQLIEEQRAGTELILHGTIAGRDDWIALGWRALDVGIGWQQPDGGFGTRGYFHSNSLFLEALARACIIDPTGATEPRRQCLDRGCAWLVDPINRARGAEQNRPYTHRRYILAACFGEAGRVLGQPALTSEAARWAQEGLALQRPDGLNPEAAGADVSYQMVGVLATLIYYPLATPALQRRLRNMVRRAIAWELPHIQESGEVSMQGSTRVGVEVVAGKVKQPNYPEIFQALCLASSIMPNRAWTDAAIAVARFSHLPLPANAGL